MHTTIADPGSFSPHDPLIDSILRTDAARHARDDAERALRQEQFRYEWYRITAPDMLVFFRKDLLVYAKQAPTEADRHYFGAIPDQWGYGSGLYRFGQRFTQAQVACLEP